MRGIDWPHLCRSGQCVDLTTEECSVLYTSGDPFQSTDPFIVGAVAVEAPVSLGRNPFFWNVTTAIDEFARNGGLPVGGVSRNIIVLVCSTDFEAAAVDRAMDHLVGTVRVPGIFMLTTFAGDLQRAAQRVFEERGQDVLFLSNSGLSPDLDAAHNGRVWHVLASEARRLAVIRSLLERVEQDVNSDRARPTRLVAPPNERLLEILRINDAPALSQLDVNVFVPGYGRPIDIGVVEPDIVLTGWTGDIPDYDAQAAAAGVRLPFYVLASDSFETVEGELHAALAQDPTLHRRVVGVRTAGADDPSVRTSYLLRSSSAPVDVNLDETEHLYDLAYLMFYAAAAAPTERGILDGTALRDGLRRLLVGDRYDVGPSDIDAILSLLATDPNATLRLYGTLGDPDFDPNIGERLRFGSVWCVDENLSRVYDALQYDPVSGSLVGDFPCFDF